MTTSPSIAASLAGLERCHAVVALGAVAIAAVAGGRPAFLAVAAGALLSVANLRAIRWLAAKAVVAASPAAAGRLVTGLLGKLVALFVLVWGALRLGHFALLPFAAGLFVFVPTLLGWGLVIGYRDRNESLPEGSI